MARQQFMVQTEDITTKHAAADDAVLGAWLRLCCYSSPRLLGGRLPGAARWTEAGAMRTAGVARSTLDQVVAAGLAQWAGDDLVLESYDHEGEAIWKRKSAGGSSGRAKQTSGLHSGSPAGTPRGVPTPLPAAYPTPVPEPFYSGEARGESPGVSMGHPSGVPRGDCDSVSDSEVRAAAGIAREGLAAAAAAPPGQWSPENAALLATSLGGRATLGAEDLAGQWRNAFAGLTTKQVQAIWLAAGAPITLPSHFRTHRSEIEEAEEDARLAEQARQRAAQRRQEAEAKEADEQAAAQRRHAAVATDRARAERLLAAIDADLPRWIPELSQRAKMLVDQLRIALAGKRAPGLLLAQVLTELPTELREAVTTQGAA